MQTRKYEAESDNIFLEYPRSAHMGYISGFHLLSTNEKERPFFSAWPLGWRCPFTPVHDQLLALGEVGDALRKETRSHKFYGKLAKTRSCRFSYFADCRH